MGALISLQMLIRSGEQHPAPTREGEARENDGSTDFFEGLKCFPKAPSNTLPRNRLGGDLIASPSFPVARAARGTPPSRTQITGPTTEERLTHTRLEAAL